MIQRPSLMCEADRMAEHPTTSPDLGEEVYELPVDLKTPRPARVYF